MAQSRLQYLLQPAVDQPPLKSQGADVHKSNRVSSTQVCMESVRHGALAQGSSKHQHQTVLVISPQCEVLAVPALVKSLVNQPKRYSRSRSERYPWHACMCSVLANRLFCSYTAYSACAVTGLAMANLNSIASVAGGSACSTFAVYIS